MAHYCTAFLNIDLTAGCNWAKSEQHCLLHPNQNWQGHPRVFGLFAWANVEEGECFCRKLTQCCSGLPGGNRFVVLHKQVWNPDDGEMTRIRPKGRRRRGPRTSSSEYSGRGM